MNARPVMFPHARFAWVGIVLSLSVISRSPAQEANRILPADQVQVQPRGPLHEAFAQPNDPIPQPGQAVPKEPPPPIPELPPEQRPEGANVQWLAGYWAWDAPRNEFVWV